MDPGPGPAYPTSTLEALARQMNTAETLAESGQLLDARPIWAYVSSQAPGSLLSLRASLLLAEDALERRDVPAAHGWLEQATLPDQAPSTAGDLETLSSLVDRRDRLISGLAAISLTPPKLREAEEAQEPGQGGDPGSVGVLLPLSGPYAHYGQMAKRGLDIALEGAPFEVHVVDTAGEAQGAADGVRHLVENLHVIALVGPIGRVETRAAATEAADLGVPLISLTSYAEAVAGSRSTVRIRLSPSEHARAVVRHAVAELGLQRLAVIHPQSTFGLGVLEAFWSEGRRLGATLGVVHGLAKNGQTSRSRKHRASSVRQASASAVAAAAALKEAMAEEGPLASSFEALFLPETRAERIREIVRVLHGRGVPLRVHPSVLEREGRTTVQLLGLGGFNGRSAIDPGDHLTDNAIFAVGFAHDPERPENDRFVRSYLARHGEKPKKYAEYAAAAFDAGNLVRALQRAARAQPASPRRAARLALEKTRHVRGALGDRTLLAGGRLVGRSTLLTIQKDVIRVRLPEAEEATVRPRPRRPRKR
jgi:ABC-type branched-subunit amino acid transport system substrate-binding protein